MSWKTALGLLTVSVIGSAAAMGCSSSSSSGTPASTPDASIADAATPSDAEVSDAGSDAATDDAASCDPIDQTGFKPTFQPPVHKAACTPSQITGVRQCLSDFITQRDANTPSCTRFYASDSGTDRSCYSCVIRGSKDESGPILTTDGAHFSINQPGCVALATNDPTGKVECVAAVQAQGDCVNRACAADCANVSDSALANCQTAAQSGTCKSFVDAYDACAATQSDDAGAGNVCLGSNDFFQLYDTIVPLFCGGASDAGTDSGTDSGVDAGH